MNHEQDGVGNEGALDSWKEIAAYLGRQVKTVQRWEKDEKLPVHRHSHKSRSSVYAYQSEIDAWRASRRAAVEIVPAQPRPLWRVPSFTLTVLLCLVLAGSGIRTEAASADPRRPLAKRLLCSDCVDSEADFSRDGRLMAFTDWNSGDLAIRDISTGKVKRLMAKPGTWKDGEESAQNPAFSLDSRQIAYYWKLGGRDSGGQLRVTSSEAGGKSRVLIDSPNYVWFWPAAWFPDGTALLAFIGKTDHTSSLARVSLPDGAVKVLKPLEWRLYNAGSRPNFSPDGRYIVYSARAVNPSKAPPVDSDPPDAHVYILAADGSSETEIVKTSGSNENAVWTPDGKHILFTSDRSGRVDLWSIAVQNGKVSGAQSLVSTDIGRGGTYGMRGGSYYYGQFYHTIEYISIAEIGRNGSENFVGTQPMWSPDGKSLSLKRRHPGSADGSDFYDLVVHSLATGEERIYPAASGSSGRGGGSWMHDGKGILVGFGRPGEEKQWIYRVDLKSGAFQQLPVELAGGGISKDDATFYQVNADPKTGNSLIVAVDIKGGKQGPNVALPFGGQTAARVRPDDKMVAILRTDHGPPSRQAHLDLVGVDGANYREIFAHSPAKEILPNVLQWSRDARWVQFAMRIDDKWQIMRVPVAGGAPEFSGFEGTGSIQGFDISPDGSRIAYSIAKEVREAWALDNVLSALK